MTSIMKSEPGRSIRRSLGAAAGLGAAAAVDTALAAPGVAVSAACATAAAAAAPLAPATTACFRKWRRSLVTAAAAAWTSGWGWVSAIVLLLSWAGLRQRRRWLQ